MGGTGSCDEGGGREGVTITAGNSGHVPDRIGLGIVGVGGMTVRIAGIVTGIEPVSQGKVREIDIPGPVVMTGLCPCI